MPDAAIGIPDRSRFEPIPDKPGDWEYAVQHHVARRAGPHYDLRLGEGDNAHSWAVRRWPKPGEKVLAIQQPTHQVSYMDFGGRIPSGYGAGTVRLADRDKVNVLRSGPDHITFHRYEGKKADEYTMVRTHGNSWLLINTSTTPNKYDLPKDRPAYGVTEFGQQLAKQEGIMSPKVSGAHGLVVLQEGKTPRVFSARESVTGDAIEWTHKIPHVWGYKTPRGVNGVLRAEVFMADKDGKPLPEQHTAGVLNAGIRRGLEMQKDTGGLRIMPFSFADKENVSLSYEDQLARISAIRKSLPIFHEMPVARTPDEKSKLLKQVGSGKHPLTTEGVVIWNKKPTKAKLVAEADVYPASVLPGAGKYQGSAGAVEYSREPGGPVVGKFGTGLKDAFREELWKNRLGVKGRVAVLAYNKEMPSGALYGPRFQRWHTEKDPGEYTMPEDVTAKAAFKQAFVETLNRRGIPKSAVARFMSKQGGWDKLLSGLGTMAEYGGLATVTIPAVTGAVTGYLGRNLAQADDETLDEVKQKEQINEFRRLNAQVKDRIRRKQLAKRHHSGDVASAV